MCRFNDSSYRVLTDVYFKNKMATSFISNYEAPDVAAIKLSTDSANIWSISPPDKRRMKEELGSKNPVTVKLQYTVSHKSSSKSDAGIIKEEINIVLDATVDSKPNPVRQGLLDFLEGKPDVEPVELAFLWPKFLKVTNRGTAATIPQLMEPVPGS